jgi:hypothetical protein
MAKIVLGVGSSHTPILTLPATEWGPRAEADYANAALNHSDGRLVNYEELFAEVGAAYSDVISIQELERKAAICHASLDRLADALEAAAPDVIIIVGDDQEELFSPANQPAISIFYGDEVVTSSKYGAEDLPEWLRVVGREYLMDRPHVIKGDPAFAQRIISGLLDRDVDISVCERVENSAKAGFGHAYGFIVNRLLRRTGIPVVPLLLNTYYPPNVLSAARCHDIGRALRAAIEAAPEPLKVAIIASGGLSHFIIDEELDRRVIQGLEPGQSDLLRSLPRGALNSGSSEILNWVLTAGAVEGLPLSWCEYVPIYRTPAGTGVGVSFAVWSPDSKSEGGTGGQA